METAGLWSQRNRRQHVGSRVEFRTPRRWKTLLGTPVCKLRLRQGVSVSASHDRQNLDPVGRRQDRRARGAGGGPSGTSEAPRPRRPGLVQHQQNGTSARQLKEHGLVVSEEPQAAHGLIGLVQDTAAAVDLARHSCTQASAAPGCLGFGLTRPPEPEPS